MRAKTFDGVTRPGDPEREDTTLATASPFAAVAALASSRRGLLKGAVAGVVGVAGTALTVPLVQASGESVSFILSVARTAEQLAVTFYSHGIAHHQQLGITGSDLAYLQAAVVEEQLHLNFEAANGGRSLASTFSFPHGDDTFEHLSVFIATLEQLEFDFIAAYLAATMEFAQMGHARLAQIASQIGGVECEHRALGRDIGGLVPADNVGFEPVLLSSVGAAVGALKAQGYLNPRKGNSYAYQPVSTAGHGVIYRHP